MIVMRKLAVFMLVLLVACSPTPTVTSIPTDIANETISTAIPENVSPTPNVPPTAISAEAGLWLQVLSPLDETVVNAPQVDVLGSAPAGTVISVNDVILIVGADGQFKTTVPLEEGPNLIEIIASDADGNEASALLTVTYEP